MRQIAEEGRFWFDATCSDELVRALKPHLKKHDKILPPWVDSIHVDSRQLPDDVTCTSEINVDVEYRRGFLTIHPKWLELIPQHREQAIVHELVHALTEPQRRFARDLVLLLSDMKPDLKDYFREQLRKANESTTEDITLMLGRLGYWRVQ